MTVGIARKLMGSLVESTLMHGAEIILGCSRRCREGPGALRMYF